MRKLVMLAAIVAVVIVVAAPAIAQVTQEFSESSATSGAASPSFSASNSGNNVNSCPTNQQPVNTGNVLNEQGVVQYQTKTDDIDFTGSDITMEPSVTAACTETMEQAAAAK